MSNVNQDKIFTELRIQVLELIEKEIEKLAEKIGLILEREVKDVLKQNDKYATGDAYKSVRSKVTKLTHAYIIKTFLGVNYGIFIHEDTRPHWPPLNKIQKWVKLKGLAGRYSVKTHRRLGKKLDQHKEDRQIAWLIARKIARKGTKGIKFFELALKQGLPIIEKQMDGFSIA